MLAYFRFKNIVKTVMAGRFQNNVFFYEDENKVIAHRNINELYI